MRTDYDEKITLQVCTQCGIVSVLDYREDQHRCPVCGGVVFIEIRDGDA